MFVYGRQDRVDLAEIRYHGMDNMHASSKFGSTSLNLFHATPRLTVTNAAMRASNQAYAWYPMALCAPLGLYLYIHVELDSGNVLL